MDGAKREMKNSLQTRLSLWLSYAILIIALVAGGIAFISAFNEAHELQDDVLRQVATMFDRHHLPVPAGGFGRVAVSDPESRVFVQMLSVPPAGGVGTAGNPALALPPDLRDGLQTVGIGRVTYRVMVRTLAGGERIAVAQETEVRDEIARDSALRTLLPFLILVPVMLLVVALLVRRIFRKVADLSVEIDRRGEQELHPIAPEPLPVEIRPFVEAINRLFGRVEQAMDAQRRFVADAAHELRSPLTAISLQAERLAQMKLSSAAHEQLGVLRQGIERGRGLLEQLLALARANSSAVAPGRPMSVQSVQRLFRQVLEELMPLAEAKGIDLGVVGDTDARLLVNEVELFSLIKNLVDNAIRYTPSGGRVDLSVLAADEAITVVVADNGPGIPEAERARVFDPFYRILGSDEIGSGLGLSIVRTIADRVGAMVSLGWANDQAQTGLRVTVAFPVEKKPHVGQIGS